MNNLPAYIYNVRTPQFRTPLKDMFNIGSDDSCDMRLFHLNSRQVRIEFKGDHYLIRDMRSGIPTFVNQTRIQEAILQEGDHINIGSYHLVFTHNSAVEESGIGLSSKNDNWNNQLKRMGNVAKTDYPILLLGPSGTGKEILSQSIHKYSARDKGPFVSVNCSALTETLIESELFGHTKGAFTGAITDRKGAFETAREGTLFLDEIGDLPYALQAKLLRALENNEVRPVGSDKNIKTDVRIIAATHQNLLDKVRMGQFRGDLYYRLNVIEVNPPSLRERMEDFEDLLYMFCRDMRVAFTNEAINKLKTHKWPGNIRELRNIVARASALFPKSRLESEQVDMLMSGLECSKNNKDRTIKRPYTIKEMEKELIEKKLIQTNGNQRQAAYELGMPKSTLFDRIRTYKIDIDNLISSHRMSYAAPSI